MKVRRGGGDGGNMRFQERVEGVRTIQEGRDRGVESRVLNMQEIR